MSFPISKHHGSHLKNQTFPPSRYCCLEVDHLVIYVESGDPKRILPRSLRFAFADCIVQRTEPYTVSRTIFFENIYLEIVCLKDVTIDTKRAALTKTNPLMCTHLQRTRASPFELGLRYTLHSSTQNQLYRNHGVEWIQSNASIHYASDNLMAIEEPMCFVIPDSLRLNTWLDPSLKIHRTLTTHPLGVHQVTDIAITACTSNNLSSAISMITQDKIATIKHGMAPLLELTFDNGATGKVIDARPHLPILFKY